MSARTSVAAPRWWACYSFRQQAVHVESEAESLATNLRAFKNDRAVDFVPLAAFSTEVEAREFLRGIQAMRDQRQKTGGGAWN